jgi:hypothetical protein
LSAGAGGVQTVTLLQRLAEFLIVKRAKAFFCSLAVLVSGCAAKPELPLPPPRADMCAGDYQSFRYGKAAAAVEEIAALRAHNFNEARYEQRCLLGDRSKSLGPR